MFVDVAQPAAPHFPRPPHVPRVGHELQDLVPERPVVDAVPVLAAEVEDDVVVPQLLVKELGEVTSVDAVVLRVTLRRGGTE